MRTTNRKIKSLRDLRKHKQFLKKEMADCERIFVKNYLVFRPSFANKLHEPTEGATGSSFFDAFYRFSLNAKRGMDIYRLLSSIYSDYKRDK